MEVLVVSARFHQAVPDLGLSRIGQAGGAVCFLSGHREQQNAEKPFHLGGFAGQPALPLTGPVTLASHSNLTVLIYEMGLMVEPTSQGGWEPCVSY